MNPSASLAGSGRILRVGQGISSMAHELFWHGTSSARLDTILRDGLSARPERRVYAAHRGAYWDRPSERSLDGIYLAACPDIALGHAELAAQTFGGAPTLLAVLADEAEALPDEDRMPVRRILRETLSALDLSTDTDGHAIMRGRWIRDRAFRSRALRLATEIGHGWLLKAPHGMAPDHALTAEILLAGTDRLLVHLSDHDALMRLVGAARTRLPFPLPAGPQHVAEQEDRYLRLHDAVGRAYRHLALRASYGRSPLEHTLRVPFDIGTAGETRIAAALVADEGVLEIAFGELPEGADLSRVLDRNGMAMGATAAARSPR